MRTLILLERERQARTSWAQPSMSRSRVEIINPAPGGSRFTSQNRAEHFVRRGHAVMEGNKLRFLPVTEGFRERLARAEAAAEFMRNRGERVYWNGSRPWGAY